MQKKQCGRLIQTAYYQAGKIVVQTLLPQHPPVALITLNIFGITSSTSADTHISIDNTQCCSSLESRLIGLYGGKAASLLFEYQVLYKQTKGGTQEPKGIGSQTIRDIQLNFFQKSKENRSIFLIPPPTGNSKKIMRFDLPLAYSSDQQALKGYRVHFTKIGFAGAGNNPFQSNVGNVENQAAHRLASTMVKNWNFYSIDYLLGNNKSIHSLEEDFFYPVSSPSKVVPYSIRNINVAEKKHSLGLLSPYPAVLQSSPAVLRSSRRAASQEQFSENFLLRNDKTIYLKQNQRGETLSFNKKNMKRNLTTPHIFIAAWGKKNQQFLGGSANPLLAKRGKKIGLVRTLDSLFIPKKAPGMVHLHTQVQFSGASELNCVKRVKEFQFHFNKNSVCFANPLFENYLRFFSVLPTGKRALYTLAYQTLQCLPTKKNETCLRSCEAANRLPEGFTLPSSIHPVFLGERRYTEGRNTKKKASLWLARQYKTILKKKGNLVTWQASKVLLSAEGTLRRGFSWIGNWSSLLPRRGSSLYFSRQLGIVKNIRSGVLSNEKITDGHNVTITTKGGTGSYVRTPFQLREALGLHTDKSVGSKPQDNCLPFGSARPKVLIVKSMLRQLAQMALITKIDEKYLRFAISQTRNPFQVCATTDSYAVLGGSKFSYNDTRTSVEDIGEKISLSTDAFQIINPLQFSNVQRDCFNSGWFRLYLPDIEATEFLKNVANYYFSLGLQTLTLSSSKELTRILYANIPECFLASPLAQTLPSVNFHSSLCFLYTESKYRLACGKCIFWLAKQKVPKVRSKGLAFSPTTWGSVGSEAAPIPGINSALSLNLKDCSFSIIQKVFFCCGDNNLSIGIGLLRSAAKRRNQLNLKNLSVDYVTCGMQPKGTQRITCFAPTVLINNEYSYDTLLLATYAFVGMRGRGIGSLKQKQISYPTISMVFWGFLKPWKMNRFVNIDFRQSLADLLQVLTIPKHTAIRAYGFAKQPMLPSDSEGSKGEAQGNGGIPQVRNRSPGNIASQFRGVSNGGLSCYPEGSFTPYSKGVLNLRNNTSLHSCVTFRKTAGTEGTAGSNAKILLRSTKKNSVAIEKEQCVQTYRRSQRHKTNTSSFVVEKEFLVHALINNCFGKSLRLVNQNRQLIDYFVDYLIRFQILRQHQILYIFSTLLLTCKK